MLHGVNFKRPSGSMSTCCVQIRSFLLRKFKWIGIDASRLFSPNALTKGSSAPRKQMQVSDCDVSVVTKHFSSHWLSFSWLHAVTVISAVATRSEQTIFGQGSWHPELAAAGIGFLRDVWIHAESLEVRLAKCGRVRIAQSKTIVETVRMIR